MEPLNAKLLDTRAPVVRRLNFGCGGVVAPGWSNYDVRGRPGVTLPDKRDEWGRPLLPYPDDTFDVVVANHSLCAIEQREVPHTLGEIRRVLKAGGVARIIVPDILAAFNAWSVGDLAWFPTREVAQVDEAFSLYVTWFSENRSIFMGRYLLQLVQDAQLEARLVSANHSYGGEAACELDSRFNESLFVEGLKVHGT